MQIKHLASALALVLSSQLAHAAILFDTNFSSPLNVSGQPIAINGTPQTPSKVTMGSVIMQPGFAGQAGNWAVFNAPSCDYDQIEFKLPAGLSKAYVAWDVVPSKIGGSSDSFSVSLDSSNYGARSLNMHGMNSDIYLFNSGTQPARIALVDQHKYRVLARVDAASDLLEITIDDTLFYKGKFGSSDLTGVRFTLSPWTGAPTNCVAATAAISNVRIYENPSDIQVLPSPKLSVVFQPATTLPLSLPASGGVVSYLRGFKNLDSVPLNYYTWVTTTLPDGTGFQLRAPSTGTLAAGVATAVTQYTFSIPNWFPAGQYKARMAVVNQATGESAYSDIPFIKTAP